VIPPFEASHEAFRLEVRSWVASELRPRVDEWEAAQWFPSEVIKWVADKGWMGFEDPVMGAVFTEELARCGSGGLAAGIGAHSGIATPPIRRFGTPDQKRRYLEPAMRAELIGALAITEPGGGSDVASARTRADRVDGGWLVNGEKTFITNGVRADFYVTALRTAPEGGHNGMSFLIIDRGDGITTSKLEKLGWHASDTATVAFEDVFVREDNLLGERNRGFYLIMANFQGERLGMALVALGEMRETFESTVEWARGAGIGQAARHQLAAMATDIEACAALTYQTLRRMAAGEDAVREVTMAKLMTQRTNVRLQEACLLLRGYDGYTAGVLERRLRDARLGPIGGGTDEIMREILGRIVTPAS
jgi:acyl-CoA dehydrogenase